jgi:hypothetical protein
VELMETPEGNRVVPKKYATFDKNRFPYGKWN